MIFKSSAINHGANETEHKPMYTTFIWDLMMVHLAFFRFLVKLECIISFTIQAAKYWMFLLEDPVKY